MGKNTKRKNTNAKKDILKQNNARLNEIMKTCFTRLFNISLSKCLNEYSEETMNKAIDEIRDVYYSMDKKEVEGITDERYFIDLLNYTCEIMTLVRIKGTIYKDDSTFFINKVRDMHNENNIGYELYVFASKVGILLENEELYSKENRYLIPAISDITDAIFLFLETSITFIHKFKNYKMVEFYEKDSNIELKYEKTLAFAQEVIDSAYKDMIKGEYNTNFKLITEEITSKMHKIYSNYICRDFNSEYYLEWSGGIIFEQLYNLPIINSEGKAIPLNDLLKIPDERKYVYSKEGIRFDFLEEDSDISHIDMIESKEYIYVNIFFKNNGGIFILNPAKENKTTEFTAKIFKYPFRIEKQLLKDKKDLADLLKAIQSVGYDVGQTKMTMTMIALIKTLILNCIYCAYYDFKIFNGVVKVSNRTTSKHNKKQGRNSGFRVGYIRKLPMGYNMSDEAKLNAKKADIIEIPQGYTYVKSVDADDEPSKKVIKIK